MRLIYFILPVFLIISGCFNQGSENCLYLNGRIEGDQYDVGTEYGGRVVAIYHSEGDDVKKGDLLASLDSSEAEADLSRAEADYRALLSTVKAKEQELSYYREKLSALEFKLSEVKRAVKLGVETAEDRLRVAKTQFVSSQAAFDKAMATFKKVASDYSRYKKLYARRVISESQFDQVELAYRAAKADLQSAREALNAARINLSIAKKQVALSKNRRKEILSLEREVEALKSTVKAKEREVLVYREKADAARALVEKARAVLNNLRITSPVTGTIAEKLVEPGEVVAPGQKLFTLYNLENLYFEGYVPERKVGLIHIGQKGYVVVDSYPNRRFPVVVTYVSSRAEFTPKEVQTKEERVKEVFKVKLKLLKNPDHVLKPGMPADCYIPLERDETR